MKFNVGMYLKRIQYSGSLAPGLDLLEELQKQHLLHIPFESLDILNKVHIELDINRILKNIFMKRQER